MTIGAVNIPEIASLRQEIIDAAVEVHLWSQRADIVMMNLLRHEGACKRLLPRQDLMACPIGAVPSTVKELAQGSVGILLAAPLPRAFNCPRP